jgi:predicted O-methyltransferase YrrM
MIRFDPAPIVAAYNEYKDDLERMKRPETNQTGYNVDNSFYTSPDCDVLYLMVRSLKPRRVVEIGCGNSTRITRQAIIDGGFETELVAIDPSPRADIANLPNRFFQARLEDIEDFVGQFDLKDGDILFVDSSHEVFVGNDVAAIFCQILPSLPPGVIVHVHDVFLPYEYPASFAHDDSHWGEQYIVHSLCYSGEHDVLWPGYHLQRDWVELHDQLPFLKNGRAQSFWFRWS